MTPRIGYSAGLERHPIAPADHGFRYAWLEGWAGARLCAFREVEGQWDDIARWPEGRLFGDNGEYRWRQGPEGRLHAVLLLDSGELPEAFSATAVELSPEPQDACLILWGRPAGPRGATPPGTGEDELFCGSELPEPQSYPIPAGGENRPEDNPGDQFPRLVVRKYVALADGGAGGRAAARGEPGRPAGEFVRCVGLCLA